MSFYSALDKASLEALASDPSSPGNGRIYLNTTTGPKWYFGGIWRTALDQGSSQSMSNKTSTNLRLSDYAEFAETSAPSSPSAGYSRLYFKTDGNLYKKNSAGTETPVASTPAEGYVYSDGSALQRVAAFSGNANKVPGINAAATGVEYKDITAAVAGSTVGVSHAAGSIQIQVPQASSSAYGLVSPYNTGSIVHAEEFTPTYTNSSNTSNYSHISGIYERVGGFVFMHGRCTIDTAGTTIRFFLTLPIASNLSTSAHLNGSFTVVPPTGSYVPGYIVPDTTNDRADLTATSVGTHTTVNIYYRFVYKIG